MVPPLRDREGDITLLSGFFVERYRQKLGLKHLKLAPSSLVMLNHYAWPGNVRELDHAIHRAAIIAQAHSDAELCTIKPQHIELSGATSDAQQPVHTQSNANFSVINGLSLKQAVDEFQSDYIRQVLNENNNNWAATARYLKLDPGNLHRLAKRLGLKN